MKPNGKKTWIDPLVDEANLGNTPAKRKLRAWLWTIAKHKQGRIPRKILDELERIKRKVHLYWTYPNPVMAAAAEYYRELGEEMRQDHKDEKLISFAEFWAEKSGRITGEDFEASLRSSGMEIRPHLSSYESLGEFDNYLWRLIPKLMDADWVEALRICAGPKCKKLIMSTAKWERKFCSEACKNRFWGRKNRERDKEDPPDKPFECPGNGEGMTITRDACINANGVDVRGKFRYTCPTCPYYKKGGN